jgi:hypothetical protein
VRTFPPAGATTLAPLGSITDTTPSFTWSLVDTASWYKLLLKDNTTGSYPLGIQRFGAV